MANYKLTEKDVREILRSKLPHRTLGKIYSINPSQIRRIKTGENWAHIKAEEERVS